ncbi:MAG: helix-turn-helix domain-containing protein [Butyricicoccus pullicaecorum]|nr:TetR/AcrR family transcriptional regulator [Butyricicoccus pullicaecorum]MDO4668298.1 helix-turn-helix domain-containing protein [Butyricicoccus pullicaecorum]
MRKSRNTKGRIVSAAWRLFYDQGYDNTTVDEIILESGTSKGSFYHYFEGKDALLSSLSYLFDEKYETLVSEMDTDMKSFDKLIYLNQELFAMIENSISIDLLARLYSSQLVTRGEKHLLDRSRFYYRLLRQIIAEGQAAGQLTDTLTVNEMVKMYALCERALIYDWCISGGEYSLRAYGRQMMPRFLSTLHKEYEK